MALQQEDIAYLGIPSYYGKPNNPYKNTKNFFKLFYDKQAEDIKNGRFKNEQNRIWNDVIANGTYMKKL